MVVAVDQVDQVVLEDQVEAVDQVVQAAAVDQAAAVVQVVQVDKGVIMDLKDSRDSLVLVHLEEDGITSLMR